MRHALPNALIGFSVLLAVLASYAQHRVALVIGNSTYSNVEPPTAPGPGSGPLAGNPTLQLSQNKPTPPAPAADLLVEDVPLPRNVSVSNPQNVPEDFKRFSGAWVGAWGGRLHHILIVESIMADGTANIVYAVGDNPAANVRRQWQRRDATIVGNTLRVERFATYELTGNGQLDATFEPSNGHSRATMSRIELADLTRPGATISQWPTPPAPATALPPWPLVAPAQQRAMPVIGFLDWANRRTEANPELTAFRQGLASVGFVENQNVAIEFREANGQLARLPMLAAELVRRGVSVMVVVGSRNGAYDAKRATSTIPIVFSYGGDPVRDGIVASLNRPGSNITGVTPFNSELGGKRLSLLLSLVPQAKRIAFLKTIEFPGLQQPDQQDDQFVASARAIGREVVILATRGGDYEAAFEPLIENPADAMVVANFTFRNRSKIMPLAARYKIPAIYPNRYDAAAGGLMSYGAVMTDVFRVVGNYTGRILKGENPADLPVQLPTKFEFVINLKTARTLGLEIPPNLLALADEVIE